MAATSRRQSPALIERLFREPHRFEFFQAVRVLEQAARRATRTRPPAPVGGDGEARSEAVRFKAASALAFPAAAIAELRAADDDGKGPPAMVVNFMGLTGPSGALPEHYTELLIDSVRGKNLALRDLFDLFNHRIVSLFYRAWEKYRLPAAYGRFGAGGDDPISHSVYSVVGFATPQLRGRLAVDDEALLHYSGHLSHWPRSATALEDLLSDYAGRAVRVEQFHGRWLWLAEDQRSRLPAADRPEGWFCALGVNGVVGEKLWDVQGNFRLAVGPLSYDQFVRFMPTGDELLRLVQLARLFVGPDLHFDVQLTLFKDDVPACQLATEGGFAPRLGWNTWLKSEPFRHDSSDAVFSLLGWVSEPASPVR